MNKNLLKTLLLIGLIGVSSCDQNRLFEDYQGMSMMQWADTDTVSFTYQTVKAVNPAPNPNPKGNKPGRRKPDPKKANQPKAEKAKPSTSTKPEGNAAADKPREGKKRRFSSRKKGGNNQGENKNINGNE